jgi:hypothetical protein
MKIKSLISIIIVCAIIWVVIPPKELNFNKLGMIGKNAETLIHVIGHNPHKSEVNGMGFRSIVMTFYGEKKESEVLWLMSGNRVKIYEIHCKYDDVEKLTIVSNIIVREESKVIKIFH